MPPEEDQPPVSELLSQAASHLGRIFAAEAGLMRLDLRSAKQAAAMAAVFCCLAVLLALVSVLLLGMALASGLIALGLPPWVAQFVAGASLMVLGIAALLRAQAMLRRVTGLPARVYARLTGDVDAVVKATKAEDTQ
ncbi:hypothetical protein EOK75_15650 (plasmid) [Pseudorhodobacter turbinis]|uniref:Phage holin family protein n=1 Tax=Pseudorhodobacter turbinis TaxID=2500533 RepID=A0A4P8EJI7_9RHOB|nr:phage holin family protein [Pseudorhodobacter turbinis]QCO57196.1 hypothetical protein EOK75_15650 [Pseudorhodobacter turbinis]